MALIIWRITDGKAGHDSQSIGLCNAINHIKSSECFDISIDPAFSSSKNLLFKKYPKGMNLPNPNLIIAAGHGTHLPMLAARRARGGKAIVLMKPSLPTRLFDLCIIPEHDNPPDKNNIIATAGALNRMRFNENKISDRGLFLLGGLSKHYEWRTDIIITQLKQLIEKNDHIKWAVADSPRTPKDVMQKLSSLNVNKLTLLPYNATPRSKLDEHIFQAKTIWVSRDSISMIYESLSSGARVGLFDMRANSENRINRSIDRLIKEGKLYVYTEKKMLADCIKCTPFNETERCAKLLFSKAEPAKPERN